MSIEAIVGLCVTLLLAALGHWAAMSKLTTRMETQVASFQAALAELKADVHGIRTSLDLVSRLEERLKALEQRVFYLEGGRRNGGVG